MDLALRPEDVELCAALDALLSKESAPARVRAAEALGFDPELWQALVAVGVPALAAGPDAAGAEQLVLIAEQAGRHLASAPVVESLVTARLLDRAPAGAVTDLAAAAASGRIITLAPQETAATTALLVPAGAVADTVLCYDGGELAAVTSPAPMVAAPNLGSLALADRDLTAGTRTVLATGAAAAALVDQARCEWQLLTAAQLIGLAARALEMAVDYVRGRVIFDRPVATFQTVAHRLADHATAVDGGRLLVQEAAWARDVGSPRADELAAMAYCFAAETALAVAADSLHYHGGYGFTLEYDIQLYYRRARAYPLVRGSVAQEYQALANRLYGMGGSS